MVIVDDATGPRARRLVASIGVSALAHGLFALLVFFDVMGIGSGLGLGVGPGFGVGSGGGAGLGEGRRRRSSRSRTCPSRFRRPTRPPTRR